MGLHFYGWYYENGKRLFIRGTNWIPEAMLRSSDERTYAELRYTRQSGINLVRFWGVGIAESDYFYQLCDELGLLVWQEFWMTGDTKHPQDKGVYLCNVASTVKRICNHPALAYYVASNESSAVTGTPELLMQLDGIRGYQMQSECEDVHDGSPYKQVNPMQHYENTASPRGSRVDGFNPEYGAPTLPTVEILREMMDEKDLWPVNKEIWDYLDGNGFHLMSTMYTDLVNNYSKSNFIDEFAEKETLTGPASCGFEKLSELKPAKLNISYKVRETETRYFVDVTLKNISGSIAFFTQLQFLNQNLKPVRPSFYTDNFFSLMPGESKLVTIETSK